MERRPWVPPADLGFGVVGGFAFVVGGTNTSLRAFAIRSWMAISSATRSGLRVSATYSASARRVSSACHRRCRCTSVRSWAICAGGMIGRCVSLSASNAVRFPVVRGGFSPPGRSAAGISDSARGAGGSRRWSARRVMYVVAVPTFSSTNLAPAWRAWRRRRSATRWCTSSYPEPSRRTHRRRTGSSRDPGTFSTTGEGGRRSSKPPDSWAILLRATSAAEMLSKLRCFSRAIAPIEFFTSPLAVSE
mmetsp:Transcript_57400/g.136482  ORF Transcript_57400/g.136482 Transcript_57400/m.136482 type:complete len:247 (-) Transcript_57400:1523-2263(-)